VELAQECSAAGLEIVCNDLPQWKGRARTCIGIKKAARETIETGIHSQFLLLCSMSFVSQLGDEVIH
jgi:hypothetical protein